MSARSAAPLVLITGASSGIGQALAAHYAAAGWRLALVARRADSVRDWARVQGLDPARWAVFAADVGDPDAMVAAGRACLDTLGLPQAVIANAGISVGMDSVEREDLDVMRETLATNVLGVAATKLPPEASQSDVPEWTSLNHLRLITELESAFGVELTMDEALALTSLPRIRERLERDQHDAR